MKIAFLVPDNRENFRQYDLIEPYFGTAPTGLLEGFAMLAQDGGPDVDLPIEIHVLSCTQQAITAPEKLAPNIWYHSVPVSKWGWLKSGYLGCAMAVRKKLREIKPDLVHAQGTERDCAVSAALSRYPSLLTIHGNLRLISKQVGFKPFSAMWFQSFIEGWVVPRFLGVICITSYTQQAVRAQVPRTWIVPNAVDRSFIKLGKSKIDSLLLAVPAFQKRKEKKIILCVATIEERKNQHALLQALDPIAEQYDLDVRFFGKNESTPYGSEFLSMVGSRSWATYGGMIGREQLRDEFAIADLLVLPTHEDNCPMVVLEAMASGVPVLASQVGGIPDLLIEDETGVFMNPMKIESITNGVLKYLLDDTFSERIVRNALQAAESRFHPLVIAQCHVEIYQEVLASL